MLESAGGTVGFFKAMTPVLIANVLTVTFVYCFVKIGQLEQKGEEDGRLGLIERETDFLFAAFLPAIDLTSGNFPGID